MQNAVANRRREMAAVESKARTLGQNMTLAEIDETSEGAAGFYETGGEKRRVCHVFSALYRSDVRRCAIAIRIDLSRMDSPKTKCECSARTRQTPPRWRKCACVVVFFNSVLSKWYVWVIYVKLIHPGY